MKALVRARRLLRPGQPARPEAVTLTPIGVVRSSLRDLRFRDTSGQRATIEVLPEFAPALLGLEGFSHLIVLTWLDRVSDAERAKLCEQPGGSPSLPLLGAFALRTHHRPNPIGLTVARLERVTGTSVALVGARGEAMTAARRPFTVPSSSQDENRFWFWDQSHFPRPVSPAAECFDLPAMASGFAGAARELRRPLAGQHVRVERGFVYFGIDLPPSAGALAGREAAYRATVDPLIGGALADWRDRLEPRAESINAELRRLAAGPIVPGAIPILLAEARSLRAGLWQIHDRALVPAMEAVARFQAAYAERLGGVLAAQRLLQGFPNRATAAGEALELLAEAVRSRPRLAAAIAGGASRRPRSGSHDGDWFRGALAEFLDAYGAKAEGWDVGTPTWAEDPRPVIAAIRERLRQGESEPGAHRRRAADDRERAVTAALASLPPDDRSSFVDALTAAQAYPMVSEDHNTVIDQQGMAALRAVLLAAGAVFAEHGAIARPQDIVWLTENEIARAATNAQSLARVPRLRRARHRRRLRLVPPRTLGAPLPAWAAHNPTLADFFGLGGEPETGAGRLHGTGASAGESTGRARVVRSLDEIDRLEAGDILVCPTTSPVWTPWLGLIAGAVVETGGVLSHTAVLAREYGVPCVTGVRDATRRIPNGALVRVDGTSGAVSWRDDPHTA